MAKKAPMNAPKKTRVFKTRDMDELAKLTDKLWRKRIHYKLSVKTYAPGEAVKFIITTDPMTDEVREEIANAIITTPIVNK